MERFPEKFWKLNFHLKIPDFLKLSQIPLYVTLDLERCYLILLFMEIYAPFMIFLCVSNAKI